MTIEQIGSIGEFLAAIATLATLVYLTVQIRQSTVTARSTATANHTQMWANLQLSLAQDESLNELLWRGLSQEPALSEVEQRQFYSLMASVMYVIEQGFEFHRDGVTRGSSWESHRSMLAWFAEQPGFREYWATWRNVRSPDFRTEVDRAVAQHSPAA